jgi:hypothetical protein
MVSVTHDNTKNSEHAESRQLYNKPRHGFDSPVALQAGQIRNLQPAFCTLSTSSSSHLVSENAPDYCNMSEDSALLGSDLDSVNWRETKL